MNTTVLKELLNRNEVPCVSIIISSEGHSFDNHEKMAIKLKNALNEVEKKLQNESGEVVRNKINANLHELKEKVDLRQLPGGVGIFATADYGRIVYFPFEVKDKTIVNDHFEIRDVIASRNLLKPYLVLLLSKGKTRLFTGSGMKLNEIEDKHFPRTYEDEYQVQKAGPGSFYHNDVSTVKQERVAKFLREADKSLDHYRKDRPLVLIGVEKFLSTFSSVSKKAPEIAGVVEGNYDKHSPHEISELVWPVMKSYFNSENEKIKDAAINAIHQGRAVSGIQEVWDVVNRGIGKHLIVEKDYMREAHVSNTYNQLVLGDRTEKEYEKLPDAVEVIMETMLGFDDTSIHVVENDELKDHGRILLTTKY